MYLWRVAALRGGLRAGSGALPLNRLCGSGMQAIVTASQYILLGDADAAIAGGAESMSRAPYAILTQRWGERMADATVNDMLVCQLTDPVSITHMVDTVLTVPTMSSLIRIVRAVIET